MPKGRAFQVSKPGQPFERVEREFPSPGPGQVRVRVEANGICHSDVLTKEGLFPGIQYPRVPGHEVAGVVDAVGEGVTAWKSGDRVGIGWHGGHCGQCKECRKGNFRFCLVSPLVTGISYDGGYADYVLAPGVALAKIPEGLSAVEAAPLMDAGVTTFMGLRHSGAQAGNLVAVLGVGGLGHLGVQFAAKMGFDTVAIARGADKEPFVKKLGARVYIDSEKQDPAAELMKLGGARAILATATSGSAMTAVIGGLGVDGVLVVVGAPADPMTVPAYALISHRRSIAGWASGRPVDSEATMAFAMQTGVRSMNEVFPLDRAAEAYDRMMSGDARFRVVLTT
ncbi:MAG TPA: alcohol dehydrogenase catalytic domain-containing protein [Thermoanaerobaculia bacterium]|jgi:D-arabinose 1-dehydrogenase-like Zn-dependent alcohol dehydrogenase